MRAGWTDPKARPSLRGLQTPVEGTSRTRLSGSQTERSGAFHQWWFRMSHFAQGHPGPQRHSGCQGDEMMVTWFLSLIFPSSSNVVPRLR